MKIILILFIAYVLSGGEATHLYPFGAEYGDAMGQAVADGGVDIIPLTKRIKFFSHTYTDLYINTEGILSFADPFSGKIPRSFPWETKAENNIVAALFWADHDLSIGNGKLWFRETTDAAVVERARADVMNNFEDCMETFEFKDTYVAVITWANVTYQGADDIVECDDVCECMKTFDDEAFCECYVIYFDEEYCRCELVDWEGVFCKCYFNYTETDFCTCFKEYNSEEFCLCYAAHHNMNYCKCLVVFDEPYCRCKYLEGHSDEFCDCMKEYNDPDFCICLLKYDCPVLCKCVELYGEDVCECLFLELVEKKHLEIQNSRKIYNFENAKKSWADHERQQTSDARKENKRRSTHGSISQKSVSDLENTYQAVFIYNGFQAFVIYNYETITWTTGDSGGGVNGLGGIMAQVGFNKRLGKLGYNHSKAMSTDLFDLVTDTNNGVPGQWMYMLSENEKLRAPGSGKDCTDITP